MKILLCYKGRYHIRNSVTMEYLSSNCKKYGHNTELIYEQDTFGITDNVFTVPILNNIFFDESKVVKSVLNKKTDMVIFLDGFNREEWNHKIAKRIKEKRDDILMSGKRWTFL